MNSPTITMEKEAALAKLEEYERAAEKNPHAVGRTEKAILQGYRAMHSGRTGRIVGFAQRERLAQQNVGLHNGTSGARKMSAVSRDIPAR